MIEIYTLFIESLIQNYLYYLNKKYIAKVYCVGIDINYFFGDILMENIKYKTLEKYIESNEYKKYNVIKKYKILLIILLELGEIIKYYQDKCKFIHGDLKYNNIMVKIDKKCKIKIIDFGFSSLYIPIENNEYYITNIDCWHYEKNFRNINYKIEDKTHIDLLFFTIHFIITTYLYQNIEFIIINKILKLFEINNLNELYERYSRDITFVYEYSRMKQHKSYYKNFIPNNYIKIIKNELSNIEI